MINRAWSPLGGACFTNRVERWYLHGKRYVCTAEQQIGERIRGSFLFVLLSRSKYGWCRGVPRTVPLLGPSRRQHHMLVISAESSYALVRLGTTDLLPALLMPSDILLPDDWLGVRTVGIAQEEFDACCRSFNMNGRSDERHPVLFRYVRSAAHRQQSLFLYFHPALSDRCSAGRVPDALLPWQFTQYVNGTPPDLGVAAARRCEEYTIYV